MHGVPDATLGGYVAHHQRPPAFEGADGSPYTVSVEVEQTGDLRHPWVGFLVFPRWADTGVGIVGHVETDALVRDRTRQRVEEALSALPLEAVQRHLDDAIARRAQLDTEPHDESPPHPGSQPRPSAGHDPNHDTTSAGPPGADPDPDAAPGRPPETGP